MVLYCTWDCIFLQIGCFASSHNFSSTWARVIDMMDSEICSLSMCSCWHLLHGAQKELTRIFPATRITITHQVSVFSVVLPLLDEVAVFCSDLCCCSGYSFFCPSLPKKDSIQSSFSVSPPLMDPEIQTLIFIWLTATISMIFCHQVITARTPLHLRLLFILPIIYLFTTLPLRLSSIHFMGLTFFYLVWLGNSKLLLFSFNQPPLFTYPPLTLFHFISIALFPIKQSITIPDKLNHSRPPHSVVFVIKCLLLSLIVITQQFRSTLHPYFLLCLYSCHLYLSVELLLEITSFPVQAILGWEIEPQFNEPYLSTSLQDFWGHRWNLMATGILRPTVFHPVRRILGSGAAIIATFLVSGLVHEMLYYYLTRVSPTWEVTGFFVLHGFCVTAEVAVKQAVHWRFPVAVSRILTLGFVVVTGGWLFFPQVISNGLDLKTFDEYWILVRFIRRWLQL